MLDKVEGEGEYCHDLLTQVLAVRAAVEQVGVLLMELHLECCVLDGVPVEEAKMRELRDSLKSWTRLRS
jgi:DNA-binding FrmR family transcriptional regulator